MKNIKAHILFKLFTTLLVVTLLVPATVKLIHVFEHGDHEVCISENITHIHQVDLDCDFQKFQTSTFSSPILENYCFRNDQPHYKISNLTYTFLNNHRPLSFSLRGPPVLV